MEEEAAGADDDGEDIGDDSGSDDDEGDGLNPNGEAAAARNVAQTWVSAA